MRWYSVTCHQTQVTAPCRLPNPSQKGWYSINLLRKDGRLSWRLGAFRHGFPTCPSPYLTVFLSSEVLTNLTPGLKGVWPRPPTSPCLLTRSVHQLCVWRAARPEAVFCGPVVVSSTVYSPSLMAVSTRRRLTYCFGNGLNSRDVVVSTLWDAPVWDEPLWNDPGRHRSPPDRLFFSRRQSVEPRSDGSLVVRPRRRSSDDACRWTSVCRPFGVSSSSGSSVRLSSSPTVRPTKTTIHRWDKDNILGPTDSIIDERRVTQDWIEQCLTSPPTQYRLPGRRFYRSKDPTNSIKVLKEKATKEKPEKANNTKYTYYDIYIVHTKYTIKRHI